MDQIAQLITYLLYQWSQQVALIYQISVLLICCLAFPVYRFFSIKKSFVDRDNIYAPILESERNIIKRKLKRNQYHLIFFAVLSAAFLAGTLIVNTFFMKSWMQHWLRQAATDLNIELDYGALSGNMLTGRYRINDLKIHVTRAQKHIFDLAVPELAMQMKTVLFPWQKRRYQKVSIKDLGAHIRVKRLDLFHLPTKQHYFEIAEVNVQRAIQLFYASSKKPFRLIAHDLLIEDYQTQSDLFSLLFHASGTGSMNGKAFSLKHFIQGKTHKSQWDFDALPTALLSGLFEQGALSWLRRGEIRVQATHAWQYDHRVRSIWHIGLDHVKLHLDEQVNQRKELQYIALNRFLNALTPGKSFQLQGEFLLNQTPVSDVFLKRQMHHHLELALGAYLKQHLY